MTTGVNEIHLYLMNDSSVQLTSSGTTGTFDENFNQFLQHVPTALSTEWRWTVVMTRLVSGNKPIKGKTFKHFAQESHKRCAIKSRLGTRILGIHAFCRAVFAKQSVGVRAFFNITTRV